MKRLQKTPRRKLKLPKAILRICTKSNIKITSREQTGVLKSCVLSTRNAIHGIQQNQAVVCRRMQLEKQLQSQQLTDEERQNILQSLERRERDFTRLQRQRMSAADFELLTIIGRGAFGEVRNKTSNTTSQWPQHRIMQWGKRTAVKE